MNRKTILNILRKTTFLIEMVLTLLLAVGVVFSIKDLIWYFPTIWNTPSVASYALLKDFLGHVLLLVVGVELMLMLINHSMVAILELVLFVIARKMLIYADSMLDLLLGTASILIIFIMFKYFMPKVTVAAEREEYEYDADTPLEQIKNETGYPVSSGQGRTIKEALEKLAEDKRICIVEGSTVYSGELEITVTEMVDEQISKVLIAKKNLR
ncbi:MAG: transporter associated domain-containing protein [Tissierellia bacterium]|nr:transporter associated domain-containing protein [Tissierellia bacterium]